LKEETSSDDDIISSEDEKLAAEASYMICMKRRNDLKDFSASMLSVQRIHFN